MKDATAIAPNDPDAMKSALATGPIAIAVSANDAYLTYKSGIITTEREMCGNEDPPNHFALSVGWGTDPDLGDFYIVKESFGTSWGESGYARIAVTQGKGTCGINQLGSYISSN